MKQNRGSNRKWDVLGTVMLGLFTLASFGAVSLYVRKVLTENEKHRFESQVNRVGKNIFESFTLLESGLTSVVALFNSQTEINRLEFREFTDAFDLKRLFPGAIGLGYIERVPDTAMDAYIAKQRQDHVEDFNVRYLGPVRGDKFVIQFVEPDNVNHKAQGLVINSEARRRLAAEQAMRTGKPTLTAPITLVQDNKKRTGFLLLHAIYKPGAVIQTDDDRFRNHIGWAYYPMIIDPLFERGISGLTQTMDFSLWDIEETGKPELLYQSLRDSAKHDHSHYLFSHSVVDVVGGRHWKIQVHVHHGFEREVVIWLPKVIFLFGWFAALMISLLFWVWRRTQWKAKTMAETMTVDLVNARDAAESASRAKSRFLATMSHEIRTPMNGVLGMVQLLQGTPLNAEQKDFCSTMKHSGESLLDIINDILDFSKIEAGKLTLEPVRFNLRDLCKETAELLGPKARVKGLNLMVDYSDDIPTYFLSDAIRIRQILVNLVSNAVKFTPKGYVKIKVTRIAQSDSASGHLMRIDVEDTGIGLNEDGISKLFRDFSQADDSTTRRFGGTGLGLAICKSLAELLGGRISVTSVEGVGSHFVLELNLQSDTSQATVVNGYSHAASGSASEPKPSSKPMDWTGVAAMSRILVAEDNMVNQKVIRKMLERYGCSVDMAANGMEAVDMAEHFPYKMIFMDCQMPEMDGFVATQTIKQSQSINAATPIIALTANASVEDREKCFANGMDDFISKPIRTEELLSILQKYLNTTAELKPTT